MIEDKLTQLKEEFEKVQAELSRLNQIGLKLSGAIEILTGIQEEKASKVDEKKEEKKEKAK